MYGNHKKVYAEYQFVYTEQLINTQFETTVFAKSLQLLQFDGNRSHVHILMRFLKVPISETSSGDIRQNSIM